MMGFRFFLMRTMTRVKAPVVPRWLDGALGAPIVPARPGGSPPRLGGQVRAGGRGLGLAVVSDGVSAVETASDGRFELILAADREFVFLVLNHPRLLQNSIATASYYEVLTENDSGEIQVVFDLPPLRGEIGALRLPA